MSLLSPTTTPPFRRIRIEHVRSRAARLAGDRHACEGEHPCGRRTWRCLTVPGSPPQSRFWTHAAMSATDLVRSPKAPIGSAVALASDAEWLEADGLGGLASGPVSGPRTRRYQALLLTATAPPTGRVVQVNGIEAFIEGEGGTVPLSTNHYSPGVIHPRGWRHLIGFEREPWPSWTFRVSPDATVRQEVLVARDTCETVLRWRLSEGARPCRLSVRLLMSGRDYHALHRTNAGFNFAPVSRVGNVSWQPYPDLPAVSAFTNGDYEQDHAF